MCTDRLPAGQSTHHVDVLHKNPGEGKSEGDRLTLVLMGQLLQVAIVNKGRKGEFIMTSQYKSDPKQEVDRAKLYWVAPRPLVIFACLLLFSVFL